NAVVEQERGGPGIDLDTPVAFQHRELRPDLRYVLRASLLGLQIQRQPFAGGKRHDQFHQQPLDAAIRPAQQGSRLLWRHATRSRNDLDTTGLRAQPAWQRDAHPYRATLPREASALFDVDGQLELA